MDDTTMKVFEKVLGDLLEDLRSLRDERVIQNVLKSKLSQEGLQLEERVILRKEGIPEIEVDLLGPELAVEVKVNPRFYDGVGQAAAMSELLGLKSILIQIWREVDERSIEAVRRIARRCGFRAFIVDLGRRRVMSI